MFAEKLANQAKNAGVAIGKVEVTDVDLEGDYAAQGLYSGRKVILANGPPPQKLEIPGEKERAGDGMTMYAAINAATI